MALSCLGALTKFACICLQSTKQRHPSILKFINLSCFFESVSICNGVAMNSVGLPYLINFFWFRMSSSTCGGKNSTVLSLASLIYIYYLLLFPSDSSFHGELILSTSTGDCNPCYAQYCKKKKLNSVQGIRNLSV